MKIGNLAEKLDYEQNRVFVSALLLYHTFNVPAPGMLRHYFYTCVRRLMCLQACEGVNSRA